MNAERGGNLIPPLSVIYMRLSLYKKKPKTILAKLKFFKGTPMSNQKNEIKKNKKADKKVDNTIDRLLEKIRQEKEVK